MRHSFPKVFLGLVAASLLNAQAPPPDGTVSPEVHADRTATFRIKAPKANEVTFYGDWMVPGKPEPMKKGADGIWTITVGPLEPNGHLYFFNLDGLAVADPINPVVKLRQRTSASLVEIPAAAPAAWEVRDVPHGTVVTEWRKSAILNRTERIVLYLPPGYEKDKAKKYPVLYLVHGSGDIPESWTNAGRANLILDNLIADGKAQPMVVVMPAGHSLPFGTTPTGPTNNELFEQYLTKEVIPGIEGTYRIAAGWKNRALAGLSMGGGHTIFTGFTHPELFSALGIFSPGLPRDFETRFKSVLADPKGFNAKVPTVWIGCGDNDGTVQYPRIKTWAESVEKAGIHATFKTYSGAHTWPVWRNSLADFAPLLFKK